MRQVRKGETFCGHYIFLVNIVAITLPLYFATLHLIDTR